MSEQINFGVLEELLQNPDVTSIMINSVDSIYYWHKWDGHLRFDKHFDNPAQLNALAVAIASMGGVDLSAENPIVETRLPDGTRAILIVPPATPHGAVIRINKQLENDMSLERFVEIGITPQSAAHFIRACMQAPLNIAVVGGYSSGKTTLLNVLVDEIPEAARLAIIQQIGDLAVNQHDKVMLETRKANVKGEGAITNRHLLETCLDLTPGRIIISELDGTEGDLLLHILNIGYSVVFAMTGTGARDALARLESSAASGNLTMPLLTIREQLANALDLIIHIEFLERGKGVIRRIMSIAEVRGMQGDMIDVASLFVHPRDGDALFATGEVPQLLEKLKAREIEVDEAWFTASN